MPEQNKTEGPLGKGARPREVREGAHPPAITGSGSGPAPNVSRTNPPTGGAGGSRPAAPSK